MIPGIGGLKENHAVFGVQTFLYAVERLLGQAFLYAYASQHAEALRRCV